jgi:4-hydroxyphenylpyruvate dioxygenase
MAMPENPLGTRGFAFVMFTGPKPDELSALFERMGVPLVARHRDKAVDLHQSGKVTFLIDRTDTAFSRGFQAVHKAGASAMGFLVDDAEKAYKGALDRGATAVEDRDDPVGLRAIEGIGGARLYLADDGLDFSKEFELVDGASWGAKGPTRLLLIDHLTHNVKRGQMKVWADYYQSIFGFREIRHFDIEGKKTGLFSKAMTSPDGNIRIPLNESQDDHSQIEEFLREYGGEGIQHIALLSEDIYDTIPTMRERGARFQDTPDTYYELLPNRLPDHGEDAEFLQAQKILVDGGEAQGGGLLLQIFTENVVGPIFFEIIQRKGNEGFGEGNFQALFESIELDQERRGVI